MKTSSVKFLVATLIVIFASISPASALYVGAGGPGTAENNPEEKARNIAACFVAVRTAEVGRIVQSTRENC